MLQLIKSPKILQLLFADFLWKIDTDEKVIYLTFDDGPHPIITPWIIDLMNQYNAKGTFFLIGDSVRRNPDLYQLYKNNGHKVGNHTYRHVKGWQSRKKKYLKEIAQCAKFVKSSLFRPPYGQINLQGIREIKKQYKVVMWDVLSWDFDTETTSEICLSNVINYSKEGSIVLFHENEKSMKNIMYALPKVLDHFTKLGYKFKAIP
tara:strand:- start:9540 stop:10154 length:615 start_codon:yes stop_codon:yes gene_type:complete